MAPITLSSFQHCKIESFFFYKQKAGVHPRPVHLPPLYQSVELVTSGHGAVNTAEGWVPVKGGDLIWNLPGDQTIGQSRFDDPYRCLSITLVGPPPEPPPPRITPGFNPTDAFNFMLETTRAFHDEAFDRDLLRTYTLGRLLFHIQSVQKTVTTPAPLILALTWIRNHYASTCSVQEISAQVGCSVAHLHYLFQKHLQISPHQAVIRERVKAARVRLVSTLQPLKQIADDCGFSDPPAFTRLFKMHTGLTPGAYRKRFQGLSGTDARPHPL